MEKQIFNIFVAMEGIEEENKRIKANTPKR